MIPAIASALWLAGIALAMSASRHIDIKDLELHHPKNSPERIVKACERPRTNIGTCALISPNSGTKSLHLELIRVITRSLFKHLKFQSQSVASYSNFGLYLGSQLEIELKEKYADPGRQRIQASRHPVDIQRRKASDSFALKVSKGHGTGLAATRRKQVASKAE